MDWKEKCINELTKSGLFENSGHRTRFKELLDCFYNKPFFTKGLCKCMYMSAWDEEHFIILLTTLTQMSLGKDEDTDEMLIIGDSMAEEETSDEALIYRLSISYLDNSEFRLDENMPLSPRTAYVIKRAQHAALVIDEINECR